VGTTWIVTPTQDLSVELPTVYSSDGSEAYEFAFTVTAVGVGEAVPAVSEWGLSAMILLTMVGGTLVFRRNDTKAFV
jgi:hypothetical protein